MRFYAQYFFNNCVRKIVLMCFEISKCLCGKFVLISALEFFHKCVLFTMPNKMLVVSISDKSYHFSDYFFGSFA